MQLAHKRTDCEVTRAENNNSVQVIRQQPIDGNRVAKGVGENVRADFRTLLQYHIDILIKLLERGSQLRDRAVRQTLNRVRDHGAAAIKLIHCQA